ncbi:MAG: GatB/YqeY domain-containing protein [Pseudomonadota bacterium]
MTGLKLQINEAMKAAMRAKDSRRLGVIRLILAAIKQREVDERITLDDTQVLEVLSKMLKQRRESIAQYQAGGRQDLADVEQYEVGVVQEFMPAQLSEQEITAIVDEAIASTGAASVKDMGKVMGVVKNRLQGRAEMGQVSAVIKARLSGA